MFDEWMQFAAHVGYLNLAAWFFGAVFLTSLSGYWALSLYEETPAEQVRFSSFMVAVVAVVVMLIMSMFGYAATRNPSTKELASTARLGSRSSWNAEQVIDLLQANGVDTRGVTGYWQLPTKKSLKTMPDAKRTKIASALVSDTRADALPSHEQLCEIMRLLIGVKGAEPDGHCVVPEQRAGALARAVSETRGNG